MLYYINVLVAETEPNPWDTTDGVTAWRCQTTNIKALSENVAPEVILSATAARWAIAVIPKVAPRVNIFCSDLGLIYAAPRGGEAEDDVLLSRRTWRQVGGLWLRVEPEYAPAATWDDITVSKLSVWRYLVNKMFKRTCSKCLYFDVKGAEQWRSKVTHVFEGASGKAGDSDGAMNAQMNDDITKISAADYRAPDFQKNEMGYCPRKNCGLAGTLMACGEFKRKG